MKFYSAESKGFFDPDLHHGKIPPDAVEVSDEQYLEIISGQNSGKEISSDANGYPILTDPPVPPVSDRRTAAKTAIDTEAGNARARFVSAGQLVAEEYLQAEQASQQWTDAGRPAGAVPADVQVWADASGRTPEQAADEILTTAGSWHALITTIRQIRLAGKAAVDAAEDQGTANDMAAVAAPFIDQLRAIKP